MLNQGFFDGSTRVAGDFQVERINVPDVLAVLPDRTVGGEEAGSGGVQHRHALPMHLITPGKTHCVLGSDVISKVGHDVEGVTAHEVVQEWTEQFSVSVAEVPHLDEADRFLQFGHRFDEISRAIAALLKCIDFFNGLAEEEEIVCTNKISDFNVGAIKGSDGEGAVHGKFHVAGAGGFLASCGDLL